MALTDSLIAFWNLNETVGTRIDAAGSNDLADNNSVLSRRGKVGNAGQFTSANSEYLSIADNTDLSMGDIDFTCTAWVYFDSKASFMSLLGKWASGTIEYVLTYNVTVDRIKFFVSSDGSAAVGIAADTFGSPPTDTWIFIVVWHDATANTINVQINNGTIDSAAHSTGVFDSTSGFAIGADDPGANFLDGRLDAVGVWKKVLSTSEKTELYNSGNALEHPFTAAPADGEELNRSLVSFYKLGEASGLRADAFGNNDLTDINTVTQAAAGKIGNAADFALATEENLDGGDIATLSPGDSDFTICAWVFPDAFTAAIATIFCKWRQGSTNREWRLSTFDISTDDIFTFSISQDGDDEKTVQASTFGDIPTGEWTFVVCWYDSVADTMYIQVNNGTIQSTASVTAPFQAAGHVRIGANSTESGGEEVDEKWWDGRIDAVGYWSRVLSSGDRNQLWNGGAGLQYSFSVNLIPTYFAPLVSRNKVARRPSHSEVFIPPIAIFNPPSGFRVESRTPTTAHLTWGSEVNFSELIEIERALGDASFAFVVRMPSAQLEFTDTGLEIATRYRYRIRTV